jgi:DNA-3-methyladenine glycosylase I
MRCSWAENADDVMRAYHDTEWAVPHHGANTLFELLCLEGAQAGLSWRTVLIRRDGYRAAFHGFDIARVADMTDADLTDVLSTGGVIRHRQKIWSVRANARAALEIPDFDSFVWDFVDGEPIINRRASPKDVPATTDISDRMSKTLKKRGFSFVGSTICYAFMQAAGMVDDHLTTCEVRGAV